MGKAIRFSFAATLLTFVASCLLGIPAFALDVPPKPVDIPIVDQTNTLGSGQKETLSKLIATERQVSGNQIGILIIPTLGDDALEDYSIKVARQWGIGTKENNNGILLLIVKDDRKLRIEVGYGLEGVLTDVQSNRIIQNDITPYFKKGQYYEGINAGVTSIIAAIHGEYTASSTPTGMAGFPLELLLTAGLIGFSWLGSILGRSKSWWAGGIVGAIGGGVIGFLLGSVFLTVLGIGILSIVGLLFDKVVSSNYRTRAGSGEPPSWWAGGGFGGGSDGGFGGFGGGDFGGGGSNGSW
jgi:uncharacterized protein